jgi:DNA-binding MarR family transcriptional regulator
MQASTNKLTTKSITKEELRSWMSVVRTYQLCNDTLIEQLKQIDLKLPQFEVLVRLYYEPDQSQQQLAMHSYVVKSHMSGLLADMIERGWVKRSDSDSDKRSKLVSLTAKGSAVAKKAAAIQTEVVGAMLAPLNAKQVSDVELTMTLVSKALENFRAK